MAQEVNNTLRNRVIKNLTLLSTKPGSFFFGGKEYTWTELLIEVKDPDSQIGNDFVKTYSEGYEQNKDFLEKFEDTTFPRKKLDIKSLLLCIFFSMMTGLSLIIILFRIFITKEQVFYFQGELFFISILCILFILFSVKYFKEISK